MNRSLIFSLIIIFIQTSSADSITLLSPPNGAKVGEYFINFIGMSWFAEGQYDYFELTVSGIAGQETQTKVTRTDSTSYVPVHPLFYNRGSDVSWYVTGYQGNSIFVSDIFYFFIVDPNATNIPTPSATPTPTPTLTATKTPTITPSKTWIPTLISTSSATPTDTPIPIKTPTPIIPPVTLYDKGLIDVLDFKVFASSVGYSKDQAYLAVAGGNQIQGQLTLYDASSLVPLNTIQAHRGLITSFDFSPSGRLLVTGSADHTVVLWDTATWREVLTFRGHTGIVNDVAFSLDETRVITVADESELKVWDVDSGKEIYDLTAVNSSFTSIDVHPDGHRFITGETGAFDPGFARMWSLDTGNQITTYPEYDSLGNDLAIVNLMNNGNRFAATGYWGREGFPLIVWSVYDGWNPILEAYFSGFSDDSKYALDSTPDGRFIATGGDMKTVHLWSTAQGSVIRRYSHTDKITGIEFSPDATRLATCSLDGTVMIWNISDLTEVQIPDWHLYPEFSLANFFFRPKY